jgi:hypothetical protein
VYRLITAFDRAWPRVLGRDAYQDANRRLIGWGTAVTRAPKGVQRAREEACWAACRGVSKSSRGAAVAAAQRVTSSLSRTGSSRGGQW